MQVASGGYNLLAVDAVSSSSSSSNELYGHFLLEPRVVQHLQQWTESEATIMSPV